MNLNLYDKDLNRIAIIGGNYVSCLWSEGYNTVGSFSLELVLTDEYKKKVRENCYVGRTDRATLMVIKSVEIDGSSIVASGKQATRILDDIAFVGTIEAGGNVPNSIKAAYEASNKHPLVVFDDVDLDAIYDNQISNKTLFELCKTMCQSEDVGFRAVKNGANIHIQFYQPKKNQSLIFSESIGNLSIDSLTMSSENKKNYAIVLGEGEGEARKRVIVDESGGGMRFEMIVDARDLQKSEEETDTDYRERLEARGHEKLLEKTETFECKFTPYSNDFGTKYDLGDILKIRLSDFGINLEARVTRFQQKAQKNTISTTVEVGEITATR